MSGQLGGWLTSKLDPYADKLSQMLRQEAGKSRKQKRTTKQLHADLALLGYDGSYNRVAAFARDWKAARQQEQKTCGRGVFVPLAFLPGEAFQFDWSEDWAVIAGERTKLPVAHFKLVAYSRAFILRAYPQQTRCYSTPITTVFGVAAGHLRQHAHCRRQDRRAIFDNMRTALRRWSAIFYSKPSSATRPPVGRKGRSRKTSRTRAIGSGLPRQTSPR